MTLRNKLKPTTSISTEGEARRFADKSVIVAEEFAIGFAEWLLIHYDKDNTPSKDKIKKLLEIYKL